MDRYDAMTLSAMLIVSLGLGLNILFLQADAATGAGRGELILVPVFAGLAIAL